VSPEGKLERLGQSNIPCIVAGHIVAQFQTRSEKSSKENSSTSSCNEILVGRVRFGRCDLLRPLQSAQDVGHFDPKQLGGVEWPAFDNLLSPGSMRARIHQAATIVDESTTALNAGQRRDWRGSDPTTRGSAGALSLTHLLQPGVDRWTRYQSLQLRTEILLQDLPCKRAREANSSAHFLRNIADGNRTLMLS